MKIRLVLFLFALLFVVNGHAYNVTFRVQMAGVSGYTTPAVSSTFNGWCGACNNMSDANADGIWETTVSLPAGYFEYKYSADNWAQQETLPVGASCTATSGQFTNRTLNVNADMVLPVVCWGSCNACVTYNVTFQVNMAGAGAFTAPNVSGTFNDWCGSCNAMEDIDGDQIWTTTLSLALGTYEYKFSYDNWAGAENLTPGAPCTITNFGYTNRYLNATQNTVLPAVCWGTCDTPVVGGPVAQVQIVLSSGNNPGCEWSELIFTASASNLQSTPVYQWRVNGVATSTNTNTFTTSDLTNGQIVTCALIGGAGCSTSGPVVSNAITVQRQAPVAPAVSISASANAPWCAGQQVTFVASPTNGGTSPVYQWKVNGINVGTNAGTFNTATLQQGDVVACTMVSNAACQSSPWNMIWSDEFNGTTLDAAKWNPEIGAGGWGNNEWQYYTASPNNIQFNNGQLHIVARNDGPQGQQYSSARLITKNLFSFKYGKVTGRMQIPMGQGIWPAFWMLGANIDQVSWPGSGEIDIMEHVNNENKIYGTAHWNNGGLNSNSGNIVTSVSGYHDYTVEWDSLSIRFLMDGAMYHQHTISTANGSMDEFTKPFFLLLNVAVGGNWPGYPDASTVFPASMDVDYVRVWQRNTAVANAAVASNSIAAAVIQPTIWYRDNDVDGFGNNAITQAACTQPIGYVTNNTDCNDNNAAVNPGATEVCGNGIDDNCAGGINEGCCNTTASVVVANASCFNSANGSVNLTVINATAPVNFAWSNGATTEDIFNISAGTYTVTITDANGCTANAVATVQSQITSLPSAAAAINGPAGACKNQTAVVFTIDPIAGATSYAWTLPAGVTGVSTSNSITLNFSNAFVGGNLCVSANNACGQGLGYCRSIAEYTVAPAAPAAILGSNVNACAGTTVSYYINAVPNATSYLWTAPTNATITAGQGTANVSITYAANFGASGTLSVRATNCKGNSAAKTITMYGKPSTPGLITGPASAVCGGSTKSYSIAAVSGATSYVWTVPAGATLLSGQGTVAIQVQFPANYTSGSISVAASSACGVSALRTITINSVPTLPASITGQSSNICGALSLTYTVPEVVGATSYNWTAPAGCTITSNIGTSVTCSFPSTFVSGLLCYTVTNACGTSVSRCASLTNKPATPASIAGSTSVCAGAQNLVYSTPQINNHTYTWTVPAGCTIVSGQGTNTVSVNWGNAAGSISVKANNACGASANKTLAVTLLTCMQSDTTNEVEITSTNQLNIFPNPSSGHFTIQSSFSGHFIIENEMGQIVRSFDMGTYNENKTIITSLTSGLYIIVGMNNGERVTQKILVIN
jgi:beta-glucanase (GH16 family)